MVWIDCEMTGLDLEKDALVELAVLVTDAELNILGDGVDVVIRPPDAALEQMDEFVRNMHTTSGLLDEARRGDDPRGSRGARDDLHKGVHPRRPQGRHGWKLDRDRPRVHRAGHG